MEELGRRLGDRRLTERGRKLAADVSDQIWVNPKNGYAFQAPEAWLVLNRDANSDGLTPVDPSQTELRTEVHRNLSYSRPLSVWDALDAEAPGLTIRQPAPRR